MGTDTGAEPIAQVLGAGIGLALVLTLFQNIATAASNVVVPQEALETAS